jgi:hypothetical protein
MDRLHVDTYTADKYIQYCYSEFSKPESIKTYEKMNGEALLDACISTIKKREDNPTHGFYYGHDSQRNTYQVRIPPPIKREYEVHSDSDDNLPPPPTFFRNHPHHSIEVPA